MDMLGQNNDEGEIMFDDISDATVQQQVTKDYLITSSEEESESEEEDEPVQTYTKESKKTGINVDAVSIE